MTNSYKFWVKFFNRFIWIGLSKLVVFMLSTGDATNDAVVAHMIGSFRWDITALFGSGGACWVDSISLGPMKSALFITRGTGGTGALILSPDWLMSHTRPRVIYIVFNGTDWADATDG